MSLLIIIVTLFFIFAISRLFLRRWKDKTINNKELIFWSTVWVSIIIVSVFPNLTQILSNFFGIGRGADIMIYISIIVLFYLMFRLYVKTEKINQDITKIVREIAKREKKK